MPGTPTTKWSLPTISPTVDLIANGPAAQINTAMAELDNLLTPNNIGVLASRPAYGKPGQTYLATDATTGAGTSGNANGTLYLDIGTAWIALSFEGAQGYWRQIFNYLVTWSTGGSRQILSFATSGGEPLLYGVTLPALVGPTAAPGVIEIVTPGVYRLSFSVEVAQISGSVESWSSGFGSIATETAASSYGSKFDLLTDSFDGSSETSSSFNLRGSTIARLAVGDYAFVEVAVQVAGSTTFETFGDFSGEWIAP
jgi:hypothetical protein